MHSLDEENLSLAVLLNNIYCPLLLKIEIASVIFSMTASNCLL